MTGKTRITKRSLTKAEADIFCQEIKQTPNITGYRPHELMDLSTILILEDTIGLFAYVETSSCIDVKILIVRESFRGKGYGRMLFSAGMKQLVDSKKPIYTVTKNPVMMHMAEQADFTKVRLWQLPLPCITHQLGMVFSLYRIKESIRKYIVLPRGNKFTYWIKYS